IGAVLKGSEMGEEGKPSQGGQATLITHGVKNAVMPTFKNRTGIMFLNQIRDDQKARISGLYTPPGGHAIKHLCRIRVELRYGGERFTVGTKEDEMIVGRSVRAIVEKNNLTETGGKVKTQFKYLSVATKEYGDVGVDWKSDVINTALRAGIIRKNGA